MHDDVVILSVDDAKTALLREDLKCFPDIAEIDHAAGARRQNVGGKYLQGRIAGLNGFRELAGEFRRRLGMQHDVVGPIAGTFSNKVLVAGLDRLQRGDAAAPIGEIDEGRGAAVECRAADLFRAGRDQRCAVRLGPFVMQMDVGVDAARHDNVSGRVDHALGRLRRKRAGGCNRRDRFAGHRDVALHDAVRRHDVAATNDEIEHRLFSRLSGEARIATATPSGTTPPGPSHQIKRRRESAS